MKILFHSDCPYWGGSENILADLLNDRRISGLYDVAFSYRYSEQYQIGVDRMIDKEIIRHPLALPYRVFPFADPPYVPKIILIGIKKFLQYVLEVPYFVVSLVTIIKTLKILRPDILHINNGGYPGSRSARAAAIAARIVGVEHVLMRVHSMAVNYRKPYRWVDYATDRLVVRSVGLFIAGSTASQTQLCEVLSLTDEDVSVIRNGIATILVDTCEIKDRMKEIFGSNESCLHIGIVGALEPFKGHKVLFQAINEIRTKSPEMFENLTLWVVGSGSIEKELRRVVERLGLEKVVRFLGQVDNAIAYISSLDILVVPSIGEEDTPNVIYEAMAVGAVVVASDLSGISEQIISRQSGILFQPGSSGDLAVALVALYTDPQLLTGLAEAGKDRFRRMFRADISVGNYVELYNSLKVRRR